MPRGTERDGGVNLPPELVGVYEPSRTGRERGEPLVKSLFFLH